MEISFERYFKLRNILQAFSVRDIQMVAVMFQWTGANGFSPDEVISYAGVFQDLRQLEAVGYFNRITTPEQGKQIRAIEKLLPPEFRREARKVRLENSFSGRLGKG